MLHSLLTSNISQRRTVNLPEPTCQIRCLSPDDRSVCWYAHETSRGARSQSECKLKHRTTRTMNEALCPTSGRTKKKKNKFERINRPMNNGKRKRRIKVLRLFSYLSNTWINSTEKEGKENKTREKTPRKFFVWRKFAVSPLIVGGRPITFVRKPQFKGLLSEWLV